MSDIPRVFRCDRHTIDAVIEFIATEWNKNHALVESRRLLDWQHANHDGTYNFIVGMVGNCVKGVLGYIPSDRFCDGPGSRRVLWLAIWKVADSCQVAGLGLALLQTLTRIESHDCVAVNGINLQVTRLYRALGYQIFQLQQYFVANPETEHKLLVAEPGSPLPVPRGNGVRFVGVGEAGLEELANSRARLEDPVKSESHFVNRFLKHPIYDYLVYRLVGEDGRTGLMAARLAEFEGSRALRLVDYVGPVDLLGGMGEGLLEQMQLKDVEYADFCLHGIAHNILLESGFEPVSVESNLIVPTYFEPFVRESHSVFGAVKTSADERFCAFRADGDQDRPNMIPA